MRKPERKFYSFHAKILLKHNFWGVVVFPSIFWVQKFCQNTIFGSSGFSFHFLSSKFQGSGFSFQFLISKFQGSGFSFQFLKIWQFFQVILNFSQECYYLKNKVVVVDFTKARGLVKFQSPRALRALGLQNITNPWAFAKSTTPTLFLR